jgi:hypothetical protein
MAISTPTQPMAKNGGRELEWSASKRIDGRQTKLPRWGSLQAHGRHGAGAVPQRLYPPVLTGTVASSEKRIDLLQEPPLTRKYWK